MWRCGQHHQSVKTNRGGDIHLLVQSEKAWDPCMSPLGPPPSGLLHPHSPVTLWEVLPWPLIQTRSSLPYPACPGSHFYLILSIFPYLFAYLLPLHPIQNVSPMKEMNSSLLFAAESPATCWVSDSYRVPSKRVKAYRSGFWVKYKQGCPMGKIMALLSETHSYRSSSSSRSFWKLIAIKIKFNWIHQTR